MLLRGADWLGPPTTVWFDGGTGTVPLGEAVGPAGRSGSVKSSNMRLVTTVKRVVLVGAGIPKCLCVDDIPFPVVGPRAEVGTVPLAEAVGGAPPMDWPLPGDGTIEVPLTDDVLLVGTGRGTKEELVGTITLAVDKDVSFVDEETGTVEFNGTTRLVDAGEPGIPVAVPGGRNGDPVSLTETTGGRGVIEPDTGAMVVEELTGTNTVVTSAVPLTRIVSTLAVSAIEVSGDGVKKEPLVG